MPTRTLHASAGLYVTAQVSAWPSPSGLNLSGAAAALARRGGAVSTAIVRGAAEAPAPAVSSAVYAPSGAVVEPAAPSQLTVDAWPLPLHDATAWPPPSRTTSCQSAAADRETPRSTESSRPSPLGLMSAVLAVERRRDAAGAAAHALGHIGADGGEEGVERAARTLGVVGLAVAGDDRERDDAAGLVLLAGAAGELGRGRRVETGDAELPGEQALQRPDRLGRRGRVGEGAHDGDAGAAGVEPVDLRPDDPAGDAAVPALVDGAVPVDEEVVADVAPAEALGVGVVRVDAAHERGSVGLSVDAAAGRVVDEGHLDRRVRRGAGTELLVGAPLGAGDDDRLRGGGAGRRLEAHAGDVAAARRSVSATREATLESPVGSMATSRTPESRAGARREPAAATWT